MPKRSKKYVPGAKRYNVFREMVKANYGGYFQEVTDRLLKECFESINEARRGSFIGLSLAAIRTLARYGATPVIDHSSWISTNNK